VLASPYTVRLTDSSQLKQLRGFPNWVYWKIFIFSALRLILYYYIKERFICIGCVFTEMKCTKQSVIGVHPCSFTGNEIYKTKCHRVHFQCSFIGNEMYKTKLPLFASKEKHVGKKHYLFLHKDFDRSKKLSQFTFNGQNFFLANTAWRFILRAVSFRSKILLVLYRVIYTTQLLPKPVACNLLATRVVAGELCAWFTCSTIQVVALCSKLHAIAIYLRLPI
jgi:hypothetical protein